MECRYVWAVFDSLVGELLKCIESEIVDLKERPGKVLKLWERLDIKEKVGKVSKFQERFWSDNFKAEKERKGKGKESFQSLPFSVDM